ncbi:MAG: ribosome small subunit-dependent GTPase A [Myxococcales bacterium]|nr:ribosome small subunit-dependent GTPase A [Myxococcales bacterium]
MSSDLDVLGWDALFAADAATSPAGEPARVCAVHRDACDLWTGADEAPVRATLPGRWRVHQADPLALPAVGDWVLYDPGDARVVRVLQRRSVFVRRSAGEGLDAQVVAANVDTVFLVCGLDGDLNVRRLRRYLAQLHDSGAAPVLLLNKADDPATAEAGRRALGALGGRYPVVTLSALHGDGVEGLAPWLRPGETVALVGSSGVGKSTLANRLLGEARQATAANRADDARGRHTTTKRELFRLPGGALLLDTPGMRSLGLWDAVEGVDAVFDDVGVAARGCRFRDCRHQGEPGCAVQAGLAEGDLEAERVAEWERLRREAAYEERKRDKGAQAAERAKWKRIHMDHRRRDRERGR